MLDYLLTGRAKRGLFRLLWGKGLHGNVSALARQAAVSFASAHRELERMRDARLVVAERVGTDLVYRANAEHPQSDLFRQLAAVPSKPLRQDPHDDEVRTWLANTGAPVGSRDPQTPTPPLETVLAEALTLSHRDPAVARVLPLALWRQRVALDMDRLVREAGQRNEKPALGLFLELAGILGKDVHLVQRARALRDNRRKRRTMFFDGAHGPYADAAARRSTPAVASRWGYTMNMEVASFRSLFEKFSER